MALMYQHKPSTPSLVLSGLTLCAGTLLCFALQQQYLRGDCSFSAVLTVGLVTIVLSGSFLIMAFSRYSFTHLWKSTGARHSDKYKNTRRRR